MFSDQNSYPSEEALVRRYESMLDKKEASYFDVEEFEEIANYYLQIQEPDKAKVVIEQAERQHPLNDSFQLVDVRILVAQSKLNEAIVLLRKNERRLKHDSDYWMLTGEVCLKLTWISVADDAFEKVLLSSSRGDYAQYCMDIGYMFSASDKLVLALKYTRKAYLHDASDLSVIDELAGLYTDLQQYDKAEALLKQHIKLEPYSVEAWFSLGLIYFDHTHEFDKALDALEYAIVVDEKFEMAHFFIGQVLIKLRRFEDALKVFKLYEQLTGQKEQAYFLYAECFEELKQFDKAIEAYNKALELGGDKKEANLGIAYCYYDLGDHVQALSIFRSVIELEDTRSEDAWFGIGDCLLALKMTLEAHDAYEMSIKLNPKQIEVYTTFADSLMAVGDVKLAMSKIDLGLHFNPGSSELLLKKAVCCFRLDAVFMACIILQQLTDNDISTDLFFEELPEAKLHEKAIIFFGW